MRNKSYNGLLALGIVSIIIGLALLMYSISSYSEIKVATDKIDFDSIDNNNSIPSNEKYYKYVSIYDDLNKKLEKNKNLPVKNMSCAYLDFAHHNVKSMYNLVFKGVSEDSARRSAVETKVKALYDMYKYYSTCKKTVLYQQELNTILEEIKKTNNFVYQDRMDNFLNGNKEIIKVDLEKDINDDVFPQYNHNNINSPSEDNLSENNEILQKTGTQEHDTGYEKVNQYIDSQKTPDTAQPQN